MPTASELTASELETYRSAARRRRVREKEALKRRQQRAWELARTAAKLLREKYGAGDIFVFGSLIHQGSFSKWSDVDIAVWGLRPEDTFVAMGTVRDLSSEIELNLVDVDTCSPSLLETIEKEGVHL
ncbi:MAG: nucleotidyltransferase domain-containing protein [Chloroflexi bacterium]|nr:nucleotidyltransferase domain-containing protein [Chloroflexota bacterium]